MYPSSGTRKRYPYSSSGAIKAVPKPIAGIFVPFARSIVFIQDYCLRNFEFKDLNNLEARFLCIGDS